MSSVRQIPNQIRFPVINYPELETLKTLIVVQSLLCSTHLVTPWTVACQAPLSMGFPNQEFWSGLPFSSSGDLPDPGITPTSPALQADSSPPSPQGTHLPV